MKHVYLVLSEYHSNVSYGVDDRTYISGAYLTKDEAEKRINYLKKELDIVKQEEHETLETYEEKRINYLKNEGPYPYKVKETFYNNAEERLGFPIEPYSDEPYSDDGWGVSFSYYELEVGDIKHCFAGGASYVE